MPSKNASKFAGIKYSKNSFLKRGEPEKVITNRPIFDVWQNIQA
jgi:hypothetical protein